MRILALIAIVGYAACASALTINFVNKCNFIVWPAVGKVSNGQPDLSVKFGRKLDPSQSASFGVDDHTVGIRAWGRTGCDANGLNCKTGACDGGLVCNDAGTNSHAIFAEYSFTDFGKDGGQRTTWDLYAVSTDINIDTMILSLDGITLVCTSAICSSNQPYKSPTDYAAGRNSALGQTYTHTFCP